MGVRSGLACSLLLGVSACAIPLEGDYALNSPGPPAEPVLAKPPPVELGAYAWLDRADALLDAISDSPPDFTFEDGTARFFGWTVGSVLIVEESRRDGYTLFLYEGGERPVFVRTHDYAAGFDRGTLAVIYTRGGGVFQGADAWREQRGALALLRRGQQVYRSAQRRRWDLAAARAWADVEIFIDLARDEWDRGWERDREFERYRRRIEAEALRRELREERRQRREAAAAFRQWRDGGFAGPPPAGLDRRRWDRDGDGLVDRQPNRPDRPDRLRDRDRDDRAERPREGEARPARPVAEEGRAPREPRRPVALPEAEEEPALTLRPGLDRVPRRVPPGPATLEPVDPRNGMAVIPASEIEREAERRREQEEAELRELQVLQAAEEERGRQRDGAAAAERARQSQEEEARRREAAAAAESQRREAEEAQAARQRAAEAEAARQAAAAAAEAEAARQAAQAETAERRREEREELNRERVAEPEA